MAISPEARAMFGIKETLPKNAEEFLEDDLEQARSFINIFNN